MTTTHKNEAQEVRPEAQNASPPANSERRQVPPPGRAMSFEEALELTLHEDKELLRRLAK